MQTTVKIEWKDLKFGAKDTTISLIIKGDPTDEQTLMLTKLKAAGSGFATLFSGQMDISDYDQSGSGDQPHEGIKYNVHPDGTTDVDPNQVTMDDAEKSGDEAGSEESTGKGAGEGAAEDSTEKTEDEVQPATEKPGPGRGRRGRTKNVDEPATPKDDDDLPF